MYCRKLGLELIEVSNGVVHINASEKAASYAKPVLWGFQSYPRSAKRTGRGQEAVASDRVTEARRDLDAGAQYVIIEAVRAEKILGV